MSLENPLGSPHSQHISLNNQKNAQHNKGGCNMHGATNSSIVSLYVSDLARLKKYHDNYYVIVVQRRGRLPGYETVTQKKHIWGSGGDSGSGDGDGCGNGNGNPTAIRRLGERFASSIYRARSKIRELGLCNDWDFLVTFTFDDKKFDRTNLTYLKGKLTDFLRNYKSAQKIKIRYLIIPEQDKNGNWHFHGLLAGLPFDYLREVDYFRKRIIFDWDDYAAKFGHIRVEEINSLDRVANYLLKQVTLEILSAARKKGSNTYYASNGLNRAVVILVGHLCKELDNPDFENRFVITKRFTDFDEALEYFAQP